mgnify:CR=1 FL=1
MNRIFLGLGSNIGNRYKYLCHGCKLVSILPKVNFILLSPVCIESWSVLSAKREHNWKTVFLGKIKEEKLLVFSISKLLDDNRWLSVATPVKKLLSWASVICRKTPFK